MNRIKFDYSQVCNFVKKEEINTLFPQAAEALKSLKTVHPKVTTSSDGWTCLLP